MSWRLDDAEALAAKYPATFLIAPRETRANLAPGEYAKAIFNFASAQHPDGHAAERMWMVIYQSHEGRYLGRLANEPTYKPDDPALHYGAWIEFEARHVINWENADEGSLASVANPTAEF